MPTKIWPKDLITPVAKLNETLLNQQAVDAEWWERFNDQTLVVYLILDQMLKESGIIEDKK
jgi:hypothetical protein